MTPFTIVQKHYNEQEDSFTNELIFTSMSNDFKEVSADIEERAHELEGFYIVYLGGDVMGSFEVYEGEVTWW